MSTVYLAIGSNLGDRLHHLQKAVAELEDHGLKVLKLSTVIETEPWEAPPQGRYLNAVLKAQTDYSPEELILVTQGIERKLGAIKRIFRGPRTMDIDILLYDDIKLTTPRLLIPHPRMLERDFVMGPLKEIEPKILYAHYKNHNSTTKSFRPALASGAENRLCADDGLFS